MQAKKQLDLSHAGPIFSHAHLVGSETILCVREKNSCPTVDASVGLANKVERSNSERANKRGNSKWSAFSPSHLSPSPSPFIGEVGEEVLFYVL
jgi:hypothetical protein